MSLNWVDAAWIICYQSTGKCKLRHRHGNNLHHHPFISHIHIIFISRNLTVAGKLGIERNRSTRDLCLSIEEATEFTTSIKCTYSWIKSNENNLRCFVPLVSRSATTHSQMSLSRILNETQNKLSVGVPLHAFEIECNWKTEHTLQRPMRVCIQRFGLHCAPLPSVYPLSSPCGFLVRSGTCLDSFFEILVLQD